MVAFGVRLLASGARRPRVPVRAGVGACSVVRGENLVPRLSGGFSVVLGRPLAVLVSTPLYASFVADWGNSLLPRAWTLRWYVQVDPRFWASIQLSVLLSLGSVLVTLLVALPLATACGDLRRCRARDAARTRPVAHRRARASSGV